MSDAMDVLIANLVNASRAAGFCRGKGLDDTADNRAEDAALDALKAENARLRAERDQYLKHSVEYGNQAERLRAALKPFATAAECAYRGAGDAAAGLGLWMPLKFLDAAKDALAFTGEQASPVKEG